MYWRLRVGDWRVIYDQQDEVRVVSIEKIKARGCLQMNAQVIRSIEGAPEYVLIPVAVYEALKDVIDDEMAGLKATQTTDADYVPFSMDDYVSNPIALMRLKSGLTQKELAERMEVSQPYLSKMEGQDKISAKLLEKVNKAVNA